jgi:hypothetical protein
MGYENYYKVYFALDINAAKKLSSKEFSQTNKIPYNGIEN